MSATGTDTEREAALGYSYSVPSEKQKLGASMSVFRAFECEVLRMLAPSALSPEQIETIIVSSELVSYEYSGVGYFLTVKHASLPQKRVVCDQPIVLGDAAGDVQCSFVLFIENSELMFECFTVGRVDVPEELRDMAVSISKTGAQQGVPADIGAPRG